MPRPTLFRVPDDKITRYLLAVDHPQGGPKAKFFLGRGFALERPDELAAALIASATRPDAREAVLDDPFGGRRLVRTGPLVCPDGTEPVVKVVWRVQPGSDAAVLVTAYPERRARPPDDPRSSS